MDNQTEIPTDEWIQWIPWHEGVDCPINPSALIQVQLRCENADDCMNDPADYAGGFDWSHTGDGNDIIAYRIVHDGTDC